MNWCVTKGSMLVAVFVLGVWPAEAQQGPAGALPAFPGAEGFGAASVGGRGGRVIKVTNLNPKGPGSLQAACEAKGPRIVVFETSGVIEGDVVIKDSNLTIAGQTAPGAGITIAGMLLKPYSNWDKPQDDPARIIYHDLIIRFLRIRPRRPRGGSGDCVQIGDVDRIILDHLSCSWASDENIDLCASRQITVQWCAIEESDKVRNPGGPEGRHNFGMIVGYAGKDASVHHNLFAHHRERAPLCGLELLDHRNNVIYNMLLPLEWHPPRMNRQRRDQPFRANVIGNYFKAGPDEKRDAKVKTLDPLMWKRPWVEVYARDNYFEWTGQPAEPTSQGPTAAEAWPAPPVRTLSPQEAYQVVLAQAGCLPRDAVSRRTVAEVRRGTGSWGRHEPQGGLMEGLRPTAAPKDSDGDGMPDAWEQAQGLNPGDPSDASKIVPAGAAPGDRHRGYTYVEYYINDLADKLILTARAPD